MTTFNKKPSAWPAMTRAPLLTAAGLMVSIAPEQQALAQTDPCAALMGGTYDAVAGTCTLSRANDGWGLGPLTIPDGVDSLQVMLRGGGFIGHGANLNSHPDNIGGRGARITGTVPVTPGQQINVNRTPSSFPGNGGSGWSNGSAACNFGGSGGQAAFMNLDGATIMAASAGGGPAARGPSGHECGASGPVSFPQSTQRGFDATNANLRNSINVQTGGNGGNGTSACRTPGGGGGAGAIRGAGGAAACSTQVNAGRGGASAYTAAVDDYTYTLAQRTGQDYTITYDAILADVSVLKSAALNTTVAGDSATADPGDVITYTFTVENTGMEDEDLSSLVLQESAANFTGSGTLPTPTFVSSSSDSPEGELLVGESAEYTATYTLTQADIDAGFVVNQANVTATSASGFDVDKDSDTSTNPDGTDITDPLNTDSSGSGSTNDDPTVVDLPAEPAVTFVKTHEVIDDNGNGAADLGETVNYTYEITNTGNVTLDAITLAETTFSGDGTPPVPAFQSSTGGSPEGTLAVGETATYTASYVLEQPEIDAGSLTNQATLTASTPNGTDDVSVVSDTGTAADGSDIPDPATDDTDGDTDPLNDPTVATLDQAPAIDLVKAADTQAFSDPVVAGDTVTYIFTAENTGNLTLGNVTLTDPLSGLSPISFVDSSAGSTSSTLLPGGTATYEATYDLTQPDLDAGVVDNQATVTADDPGDNPVTADSFAGPVFDGGTAPQDPGVPQDPNDPPGDTQVGFPQECLLETAITATDTTSLDDGATPGDLIDFTITVTNTGNVTVDDITSSQSLVSADDESIATLAPGESSEYEVTQALSQPDIDAGKVTNTAIAAGLCPNDDPVSSNEPEAEVTIPQNPAYTLIKSAATTNLSSPPQPGELIDYTFEVENTGNVTLYNLAINDAMIDGAAPLTSFDSLAPGETDSYDATYPLTQQDLNSGEVENTATAEAENVDGSETYPVVDSDTGTDPATDPITDPLTTNSSGTGNPDDDPTVTDLDQVASLSLLKSVDSVNDDDGNGSTGPGDSIDYLFEATNTGNVTLTAVDVSEITFNGNGTAPVPSFVQNSGASPQGTLQPGETATYTANYSLVQADFGLPDGRLINQAEVTANDIDSNPLTPVVSDTGTNPDGEPYSFPENVDTNQDGDPLNDPTWYDLPREIALSGVVFNDNGSGGDAHDGLVDSGEPGLGNVTLRLLEDTDGDGQCAPGAREIDSTQTRGDGSWQMAISYTEATVDACLVAETPTGLRPISESDGGNPITLGDTDDARMSLTLPPAGSRWEDINFGKVREPTLVPDQQGTVQPGGRVDYPHTFTAGTAGSVDFDLVDPTSSPSEPAWNQQVLIDPTCNGEPDASLAVTGVDVEAGDEVCLVVRVNAPANAPLDAQHSVDLTATQTLANTTVIDDVTVTDLTRTQDGQLSLQKQVRNIGLDGVAETADDGDADFTTRNEGEPCEVLRYEIRFTNTGVTAMDEVRINDSTPASTFLAAQAACPATPLPANLDSCALATPDGSNAEGYEGAVNWQFAGQLAPGEEGTVSYDVRIQGPRPGYDAQCQPN